MMWLSFIQNITFPSTVFRCVLNALEYNTQAIFGAEIWEKKNFLGQFWRISNFR